LLTICKYLRVTLKISFIL